MWCCGTMAVRSLAARGGWGLVLCDVLSYLHARTPPIIFRDMKLQNVILDSRDDSPALIDFGIARMASPGGGTAIGTWGYAPPEQVVGRAEPRSDIFALGATLHALLTNRDPEAEFAQLQRSGHDLHSAVGVLFPQASALCGRFHTRGRGAGEGHGGGCGGPLPDGRRACRGAAPGREGAGATVSEADRLFAPRW